MERGIKEFLKDRKKEGLLREIREVRPLGFGEIEADGKTYINFSSNDYLGLASHPALSAAAAGGLSPVVGTSSSRLVTGSTSLHRVLEKETAKFKRKPAALVFNSGYQANTGIISALFGRGDCVFSDRLAHASIVDGITLSGAKHFRFNHNDINHLEERLKSERNNYKNALIVTETVFSMDGDIAPLKELISLKEEYGCVLMVDEAHATGVFGDNGAGLTDGGGIPEKVDIIMGTFSKALGAFGAYAAVSGDMRDFLVNTCRSFIYSTSLPPSLIAASIEALKLVKEEPWRRKRLLENAGYFRERLAARGLDIRGSSQIVPIVVGKNDDALKMSAFLRSRGYWAAPVRPPSVPKGEARLRISVTFDHTREMLDRFISECVSE